MFIYRRILSQLFSGKSVRKLASLILSFNFKEIVRLLTKPKVISPKIFPKESVTIITTKHNLFIATQLKNLIDKTNLKCDILEGDQEYSDSKLYLIICPQAFKSLPKYYIAYQMEQTTSSRWFNKKYFDILNGAVAVIDYSLMNIRFLTSHKSFKNKVFFVPIGYLPGIKLNASKKEHDVLFYGDTNIKRRKEILAEVSEHYNLKIINNSFGPDLYNELTKAKVVLNIHYYPQSLLETTRLYECLSIGAKIVSERATDQQLHPELEMSVNFANNGDVHDILKRIKETITADVNNNSESLQFSYEKTQFFFYRFLIALDLIDFDTLEDISDYNLKSDDSFICLGMPETADRKDLFLKEKPFNLKIKMFDGLRHQIGWIGCGLSYKYLLGWANKQNLKKITICEDDVIFNAGFEKDLTTINEYLDKQEEWDLFSGLPTDVHMDTKISKVERHGGLFFIHMNKTTGTVFNIYNNKFFKKISEWNFSNQNVENTIDRYIEKVDNLKVITVFPFLVGHRPEAVSTLWHFKNKRYLEIIRKSNLTLKSKIEQFEKNN